ncbi:Glycosyltransferase involved in cell wall bisynthesis [Tangfeifania diversioriginum]|uniref:Glycosyltransferase involved in cell wall bisynthesis n=1 Tax=Tangfeifania diversioriginum TaxID=1168035 RepID=A0A1M6NNT3_9BACT|nr:glycosyltransferase family 4 protein [Tangfeifania diversioriginum]SHJ97308.1 Glycosyltransferase involved in cell wall bisynthesis [Tangfeifania diversioriginum]
MKKILFIHHAAGWGGAPKCMINLINNLDQSKYEFEVLLLKKSKIEEKLFENGIKFKVAESKFYHIFYRFFAHSEAGYVKWYNIYSFIVCGISWLLSRYIFAKIELNKLDFDIVHLNSSVLTDWLAPSSKKGKVIIHIREPFRKGKIDILHYYFRFQIRKYADKVVAISRDNAHRLNLPAITEVIYDFSEIPEILPLENSYASKKVLYLGGSSTSKGFYTMVEALDYLDRDVKVYFAGHYNICPKSKNPFGLLKYYLSNARKRNIAIYKMKNHPNAILIGLIYNVSDYIKEVCCLVSPFFVPHFSFPVVESHLHSKPVIGSDVSGMEEIIQDKINGFLFPKNKPIKLAKAINALTKDELKANRMGKAGYKRAVGCYSKKNKVNFEMVYDALVDNK